METLIGNFAGALRQGWSLWETNTPLQRDAIKHYAIAHADHVSNLIVHWARAIVVGEDFYPEDHCQRYHEHWAKLSTTSIVDAGWKKACIASHANASTGFSPNSYPEFVSLLGYAGMLAAGFQNSVSLN